MPRLCVGVRVEVEERATDNCPDDEREDNDLEVVLLESHHGGDNRGVDIFFLPMADMWQGLPPLSGALGPPCGPRSPWAPADFLGRARAKPCLGDASEHIFLSGARNTNLERPIVATTRDALTIHRDV
jgi:hypothetical protein